jgi:hypothetical protein
MADMDFGVVSPDGRASTSPLEVVSPGVDSTAAEVVFTVVAGADAGK